jgi:hypothetical protein
MLLGPPSGGEFSGVTIGRETRPRKFGSVTKLYAISHYNRTKSVIHDKGHRDLRRANLNDHLHVRGFHQPENRAVVTGT